MLQYFMGRQRYRRCGIPALGLKDNSFRFNLDFTKLFCNKESMFLVADQNWICGIRMTCTSGDRVLQQRMVVDKCV